MPDVFISYSRKNISFVRVLYDALRTVGREVWIDWQDIPISSDWQAEIFSGIESADNFLFVISPDSVASQVCGEELSHAMKSGKRLIPVVYNDVDSEHLPRVLASHNWLLMREADDFSASFQKLCEALATDLDYVKIHTRQLTRAREWEISGRNASYLLPRRFQTEAEDWLEHSATKKPTPTPLIIEYIGASRRISRAHERGIFTGITVLLVIALIAAGISFIFARTAITNSQISRTAVGFLRTTLTVSAQNLAQSESRRLATEAELAVTKGDAQLAGLLSIRALNLQNTGEAQAALLHAFGLLDPAELAEISAQGDYHMQITALCGHLSRDLTSVERASYLIAPDGPTCPPQGAELAPRL